MARRKRSSGNHAASVGARASTPDGNAAAGSSTGPGTAAATAAAEPRAKKAKKARIQAPTDNDPTNPTNPPDPAAPAPAETPTPTKRKRRRPSTTFAHKRRRGLFPGKAYVLPEGLEERRRSVLSLASASPMPMPSSPVVAGFGERRAEVNGVNGPTSSQAAPATPLASTQQSEAPNAQRQATETQTTQAEEELDPYAARLQTRRANALDSVWLSSLALGLGSEPLPSDDLLLALHAHAARFFADHGALAVPRPVWRGKLFENEKRQELAADAEENPEWTSEYRFGRRIVPDDPLAAEYEADRAAYEEDRKRGVCRRHKRADMHTALEGGALLALGILVEETVARELRLAGYEEQTGATPVAEGGSKETTTASAAE